MQRKYFKRFLEADKEIYTKTQSNGVYSLFNGWLKKPKKIEYEEITDSNKTYQDWKNKAQDLLIGDDPVEIENFIDELYKMRRESILNDGEFGEGNLVFKKLRDNEILSKLKDHKVELENKEMSLW